MGPEVQSFAGMVAFLSNLPSARDGKASGSWYSRALQGATCSKDGAVLLRLIAGAILISTESAQPPGRR
jgi:hypothetical protein